ncbi:hypothetical protein Bca52824_083280 [Brassica carinata]|nr:hypothetical protein Bca52824_083280 [Brassica carinata]
MNRDDSLIEARTVDEALAKMTVADNLPVDRHPEKRLKASFKVNLVAQIWLLLAMFDVNWITV